MRLNNPKQEPVGGWKYVYEDSFGNKSYPRSTSKKALVKKVKEDMKANNVQIPDNIEDLIEDQICMRQPKGRCNYSGGLGDRIAQAAHVFTGGVDLAFASIGVKTKFQKRARTCTGCAKRRMGLNKK